MDILKENSNNSMIIDVSELLDNRDSNTVNAHVDFTRSTAKRLVLNGTYIGSFILSMFERTGWHKSEEQASFASRDGYIVEKDGIFLSITKTGWDFREQLISVTSLPTKDQTVEFDYSKVMHQARKYFVTVEVEYDGNPSVLKREAANGRIGGNILSATVSENSY